MKMIPAGNMNWRYYPELNAAQNSHNGNWAWVVDRKVAFIYNCPAQYMLNDLAHWLQNYWCFA